MTAFAKNQLTMTTHEIEYYIYYDEITERYFVWRFALWLEVVYRPEKQERAFSGNPKSITQRESINF